MLSFLGGVASGIGSIFASRNIRRGAGDLANGIQHGGADIRIGMETISKSIDRAVDKMDIRMLEALAEVSKFTDVVAAIGEDIGENVNRFVDDIDRLTIIVERIDQEYVPELINELRSIKRNLEYGTKIMIIIIPIFLMCLSIIHASIVNPESGSLIWSGIVDFFYIILTLQVGTVLLWGGITCVMLSPFYLYNKLRCDIVASSIRLEIPRTEMVQIREDMNQILGNHLDRINELQNRVEDLENMAVLKWKVHIMDELELPCNNTFTDIISIQSPRTSRFLVSFSCLTWTTTHWTRWRIVRNNNIYINGIAGSWYYVHTNNYCCVTGAVVIELDNQENLTLQIENNSSHPTPKTKQITLCLELSE